MRGFLALAGSYVDRLYVEPGAWRRGVGRALLRHAITLSPSGIELHTHQRNGGARAFYAREGLRAVRFGLSPPPESEPDIEYHWRPGSRVDGAWPAEGEARGHSVRPTRPGP